MWLICRGTVTTNDSNIAYNELQPERHLIPIVSTVGRAYTIGGRSLVLTLTADSPEQVHKRKAPAGGEKAVCC